MELSGIVREQLPSGLYRVELEGRQVVTAHPARDIRRNFIRILEGDRVMVELSRLDRSRGRILRKL
jgi:translation initiation factor IF-1